MMVRLLGACFILVGCGSFGFLISYRDKRKIICLQNFIRAMEYMENEIQYRLTPLPELCARSATITNGTVSKIFSQLSSALTNKTSPNVSTCINSIFQRLKDIPPEITILFANLGNRFGIFDLDGQIRVISALQKEAQETLDHLKEGVEVRHRSYKTIALCAGAAIVILLV